jgi:hypothetical protein
MMVNSNPVGQRGKHAGISTDIAIKVKDDVGIKYGVRCRSLCE